MSENKWVGENFNYLLKLKKKKEEYSLVKIVDESFPSMIITVRQILGNGIWWHRPQVVPAKKCWTERG